MTSCSWEYQDDRSAASARVEDISIFLSFSLNYGELFVKDVLAAL